MIRSLLRRKTPAFFVGVVVLFLTVVWEISAQEGMLTTFSGHIIDEVGNPIPEREIAIVPVFDGNGAWFTRQTHNRPGMDDLPFHAESDAEGRFTITSATDGPVLLSLFPPRRSDVRILKVQIEGLFLYPTGMGERGVVFATSPGRRIENIKVIVQQPHIRGKVQYIDGTPIVNTKVRFRLRTVSLQSLYGTSSLSTSVRTDAKGYFTYYMDRNLAGPTFYMLSIAYQGQTVNVKPIILKPGDQTHDVVCTFDNIRDNLLSARRGGVAAGASASTSSPRPIASPSVRDVWVVNPENGHAYRKIQCEDWIDARDQATTEGAYLVTISSEAEQKWLRVVFGSQPSWIGLNDVAEEGQWKWDNGEPVTYTNWGTREPDDTDKGDEDYVFMGPSGKWEDSGSEDRKIPFIRTALIEKDALPVRK